MQTDFVEVTEISGQPVSSEQIDRLVSRYFWAAGFCPGKDVLEVGCGVGPGLGLLGSRARTFEAGDYSDAILQIARRYYGDRIRLRQLDAQQMPFANASKDVIILFEAIYSVPDPELFVAECARVLRPGGKVLITTANKDLWDFHPSVHSHRYFGVPELCSLLDRRGFDCQLFGFQRIDVAPLRQRLLRPLKRAAVASGLMPKTMSGKRWLKRFVFGRERPMPAEIDSTTGPYIEPAPIASDRIDRLHKIIYCAGTLRT
jgi:SAM-dependent methyltransferase